MSMTAPMEPESCDNEELRELVHRFLRERVDRRDMDPMTARNYRSALGIFVTVVDHLPYESDDVERWKVARAHLRPATTRGQFSMVRTFSAWLHREGLLSEDPTVGVRGRRQSRRVPRALSSPAVGRLLSVAPDARARAIIMIMVGMGLRCVEVSHLEIGDWDRSTESVMITGKFGHERLLPMPSEVRSAVHSYLLEHPASSGPLIRSYRRPGHALLADTLSGMVSEWLNASGVKRMPRDGISAHALRHTAASDVLDRCGDLRVVQELLGHSNLSTTSIYLRRAGVTKLREAMEGRDYSEDSPDP